MFGWLLAAEPDSMMASRHRPDSDVRCRASSCTPDCLNFGHTVCRGRVTLLWPTWRLFKRFNPQASRAFRDILPRVIGAASFLRLGGLSLSLRTGDHNYERP